MPPAARVPSVRRPFHVNEWLPAACVPATATYPIIATSANSVSIFDPDLQVPFTQSYSFGVQRAITRDTVIEARYVGNKNERAWTSEGWNGVNIFENGFRFFKMGYAAAEAVYLFLVILALTVIQFRFLKGSDQ